ncbi:MAG: KEOPS complex subunit Pcc1 [Nanobdellota archaeon]
MKLESTITAYGSDAADAQRIKTLFETEDKVLSNNRARYTISIKDSNVVFAIAADDSVALRAALNAITKILTIYTKMESLEN